VLLVAGGINTVISLFYYLNVLKVMTLDPPAERGGEPFPLVSLGGAVVTALTVPVLVLGLFWLGYEAALRAGGLVL